MSVSRSPLPPGPRGPVYILALMGALSALGLVLIAQALAGGIVLLAGAGAPVHDGDALRLLTLQAVLGGLLRAAASWGQAVAARSMVVTAKESLRQRVLTALLSGRKAPRSAGEGAETLLATRRLDELDKYYTEFLPALVSCATVPLLVGVRILAADWISALIIVLTIPLVPLFMILIGRHTQDSLQGAYRALDVLSAHMVELARGLPVLIGLGRAAEQRQALARLGEAHRKESMTTLKTAFLSALALELIATISVALVAVTIGVRLVNGQMPLEAGLIALILAPECYQSLRQLGTAYHASEDGKLAVAAVEELREAPASPRLDRNAMAAKADRADDSELGVAGVGTAELGVTELSITGLGITYPENGLQIGPLSFTLRPGSITTLEGPSGCGKSSLLAALVGTADAGAVVSGRLNGTDGFFAYAAQNPAFLREDVEAELLLAAQGCGSESVERALVMADARELRERSIASLSPGEQRRVALARAFMGVFRGAAALVLDEPTAHLDETRAARIRSSIRELCVDTPVLLVSHDPATLSLAGQCVHLAAQERGAISKDVPDSLPTQPVETAAATARPAALIAADPVPGDTETDVLRGSRWRLIGSVALGVLAQLFSVALAALSGWLIVHAATHPPILYLMAAIVGVRFFGIGRAVLRYTERLATHDAVFRLSTNLRARVWASLSHKAATLRTLMRGGTVLDSVVGNVDEYRDLVPRTLAPSWSAVGTSLLALVASFIVYPPAVPVVLLVLLGGLILGPALTLLFDARATGENFAAKSELLRFAGAVAGARQDLRANELTAPVLAEARDLSARAVGSARRSAWAEGIGQALVVLLTVTGAAVVPLLALASGEFGQTTAERTAVISLMLLSLAEPFQGHLAAVRLRSALREVQRRLEVTLDSGPEAMDAAKARGSRSVSPVGEAADYEVAFTALSAGWPAQEPAFEGLSGRASTGVSLGITGPSGSGKSTLLAALMGFIPARSGEIRIRGSLAWCPQEAHVFDSTIRGNLALARPRNEAASEEELWAVLDRVGLGEYVRSLPQRLDTRIGPGGSHLSGGQRQRLAVARTLVKGATVLLVDEPTAHLDAQAADALMQDLSSSVHQEALVVVSHREQDLQQLSGRLDLAATTKSIV